MKWNTSNECIDNSNQRFQDEFENTSSDDSLDILKNLENLYDDNLSEIEIEALQSLEVMEDKEYIHCLFEIDEIELEGEQWS